MSNDMKPANRRGRSRDKTETETRTKDQKHMSVKIRLRRTGKRNAPSHRIVVTDSRSPRDGRFIENLGIYDPRGKNETIDLARAEYWIGKGAQPSETVSGIIKRAKAGVPLQTRAPKVVEPPPEPVAAAEPETETAAQEPEPAEDDVKTDAEPSDEIKDPEQ